MFLRYVQQLFSVFFRWWWAAITGLFELLGAIAIPSETVVLGRAAIATLIFVFSMLLFMTLSVVFSGWRWYAQQAAHPQVLDIIPEQAGRAPLTFIVQPGDFEMRPGLFLALFRHTELGIETCAAVLEITGERQDGKGLQAAPKWISALHKTAFQKKEVRREDLRLRVVSAEALLLVEKCVKERA